MDRRTNTSDGSGGASPTVVTAQHDDDRDDLMTDTDEDTQIMATSAIRAARQKVARAAAAAKEVLANGSSAPANAGTANAGTANAGTAHGGTAADEKDAAADQVPALPADTIGMPRDSSSLGFSRSAAAPAAPEADDWALGNDSLSSSIATPEAEPAPAEEEPPSISTGTGWPADGTPFGTGVGTERSDPAPAASPASEPTVSAASFVWNTPDPEPTSPSSPARNFLRSSTTAKTSAPPPVSVAPAKASPAGAAHASTRPKASSKRSSRQAHLTIARVEPWSVMKFSFVVSLVAFVILFVAVSVIYGTLSALGVFTSLQHVVQSVTSSQDSSGVNAAKWFTASRILSYTALLGALNIVLITAMCTIGAVVYNLTSRLIGGVEVTLRETE